MVVATAAGAIANGKAHPSDGPETMVIAPMGLRKPLQQWQQFDFGGHHP